MTGGTSGSAGHAAAGQSALGGTTSAGRGGTGGAGAAPSAGSGGTAAGGGAGMHAGAGGSTAGSAGTAAGGSAGMGTTGGSAGRAAGGAGGTGAGGSGAGGMGAAAGTGPMMSCTITPTATASTAVPTVQTVTFTTSATGITAAEIDFEPASGGGTTMVAPVDLMAPMYKTYLVGMKPSTSYVYRIKVTSPAGTCTSADQTVMSGALSGAPSPMVTIMDKAKHDKGFIILSSGLGGTSGYIIDPDGTTVWVAPMGAVPGQPSRVHLSWDAKRFYAMSLNVQNTSAGKIQSVAMDGTDMQTVAGTTASHHDFTAIPGGIATLMWNSSGMDAPCSLVEFPEGGAQKTIVANFNTIYTSNTFHTNAIHYYARDDSYTIGDRNPNLFAKLSRAGALIWQFGGSSPKDPAKNFSGVTTWSVNHGHHLTADNQFAFFNNGAGTGNSSTAFVYKLDTTTMTATQTAKITGINSMVLGDAQVLPNGNVLVSGSTTGTINEVDPKNNNAVVMTIKAPQGQQFGYSEFRESLYGAPPY